MIYNHWEPEGLCRAMHNAVYNGSALNYVIIFLKIIYTFKS